MPDNDLRKKVEEFVRALSRAMQVTIMYGEEHRLSKTAVDELYAALEKALEDEQEITVGVIGDEIAFQKEPFFDLSKMIRSFVEHLKQIDLKKISFAAGIEKQELADLVSMLVIRADSLEQMGGLEGVISTMRVPHIAVGEIGYRKTADKEEGIPAPLKEHYGDGVAFLEERIKGIKGNQPLNVQSARQIVDGLVGDIVEHKSLLMMLSSVRGHGENMFEHGVNVAIFSLMQAEMLGLEEEQVSEIGMAALLHDMGEIAAAAESEGEGKDDPEAKAKRNIMGAKILLDTPDISKLAAIVAFEQDINYDMSGAPKKLYGKGEINLASMMIAISDHYDKLRREPEFLEEGGPEKAYEKMMDLSGNRFHPDMLKNFFSMMGVYPPGTLVELDTGEVALVIQSSMLDIRRPQVEVLYDNKGGKLEDPFLANLMEKDRKGKFARSIVKSISPKDKFEIPEKYSEEGG